MLRIDSALAMGVEHRIVRALVPYTCVSGPLLCMAYPSSLRGIQLVATTSQVDLSHLEQPMPLELPCESSEEPLRCEKPLGEDLA